MQQHEPTDWKIGQSADCMLWCVVKLCPKSANRENNTKTPHHIQQMESHRYTHLRIHQHTLAPLQKARMKKSMSFILFHTFTHNHCMSVCLSLCWQYMHAQTALCHSEQIMRAYTHTLKSRETWSRATHSTAQQYAACECQRCENIKWMAKWSNDFVFIRLWLCKIYVKLLFYRNIVS